MARHGAHGNRRLFVLLASRFIIVLADGGSASRKPTTEFGSSPLSMMMRAIRNIELEQRT
jgi:hypothetical protein